MECIFKIFLAFVLSFVTVSTSICYAIEMYNQQVNIKFLKKLVRVSDILFVLFLAIFFIAYGTDFILFVLLLSVVLSFVILLLYCAFVDKLWWNLFAFVLFLLCCLWCSKLRYCERLSVRLYIKCGVNKKGLVVVAWVCGNVGLCFS